MDQQKLPAAGKGDFGAGSSKTREGTLAMMISFCTSTVFCFAMPSSCCVGGQSLLHLSCSVLLYFLMSGHLCMNSIFTSVCIYGL